MIGFDYRVAILKQSIMDAMNTAELPITVLDLIVGEIKRETNNGAISAITAQKQEYEKFQEKDVLKPEIDSK